MNTSEPLHFYPADLASGIHQTWEEIVRGDHDSKPHLPSLQVLQHLFEVSYFASMETDEGRRLRFMLCVTPEEHPPTRPEGSSELECWSFTSKLAFSLIELKRLAAATDADAAAIWVTFANESTTSLKIAGICNLGRSWAVARYGFTFDYDPLPKALNIRVLEAGRIEVYQGQYKVGELAGGRMSMGNKIPPVFDLMGIQSLLTEGHQLARRKIVNPPNESPSEWHGFEYQAFCNTVLAVVNSIQLGGNGGALILQRPSSVAVRAGVLKLKYTLSEHDDYLRRDFVTAMNKRHDIAKLHRYTNGLVQYPLPDFETIVKPAFNEFREAQQNLARWCSLLGRLGGTDGAVVMRSDLSVVGFGAEIILDEAGSADAFVYQPMARDGTHLKFNSEEKGMRHRSAIRLCNRDPDTAVFVVSHDGGVSLVWNKEGKVFFQKDVRTTNTNMPLA